MKNNNEDTFGGESSRRLSLDALFGLMKDKGVSSIYVKKLSSNDNSKNQIYLGGDFSSLNLIPVKDWETVLPKSEKTKLKPADKLIRGNIDFKWIDYEGVLHPAPDAKLILYPQYPEVRFSGFLKNSNVNASEWMDVSKSGRQPDRFLVIGVHPERYCIGYLAVPGSQISAELKSKLGTQENGVLQQINFGNHNSRIILLNELRRIHLGSPIHGKKLDRSSGKTVAYNARNGAGYTLEAELGISPNGNSEPDFLGWEVKSHSRPVVTLMTPEPSGGLYRERGVDFFVRKYGYEDKNGVPDRLNFGGVYKYGVQHADTKVTLICTGYEKGVKLDLDGGLKLVDDHGNSAAEWSFKKLLEHWNRKHAKAVYVPYEARNDRDRTAYFYGDWVDLGEGTDFLKFMDSIIESKIYYDPGIKIEGQASGNPKIKRRSQFRINYKYISSLYSSWSRENLLD